MLRELQRPIDHALAKHCVVANIVAWKDIGSQAIKTPAFHPESVILGPVLCVSVLVDLNFAVSRGLLVGFEGQRFRAAGEPKPGLLPDWRQTRSHPAGSGGRVRSDEV